MKRRAAVVGVLLLATLSGCSLFGSDKTTKVTVEEFESSLGERKFIAISSKEPLPEGTTVTVSTEANEYQATLSGGLETGETAYVYLEGNEQNIGLAIGREPGQSKLMLQGKTTVTISTGDFTEEHTVYP